MIQKNLAPQHQQNERTLKEVRKTSPHKEEIDGETFSWKYWNFAFYSINLFCVVFIDGTHCYNQTHLTIEMWDVIIIKEGEK